MTNRNYHENAMTKCSKTNLFIFYLKSSPNQVLTASFAILFVSTITTCGVEGNEIPLEEGPGIISPGIPLELSVDAWNQIDHVPGEGQEDQIDNPEQQNHSLYDFLERYGLPTSLDNQMDDNNEIHDDVNVDKNVMEKKSIPRMYKKSAIPRMYKKSAIPRMYRRSGDIPRLYKKRGNFGVPRMYKRDGEGADIGTYEIFRRDQMPRLYKKSGVESENDEGSSDMQWLRQARNSALPRLYKKSIPRMYKKSRYLAAIRLGRSMTPRLYKKSYFTKKMIPRLYKRDRVPRLY